MIHKKDTDRATFTPLIIFSIFSVIIAIFWISSLLIIYNIFDTWQDRGTFGDTFGAINSLFSGLAFAGIIYTILLQRQELKLQRQELMETRKELKRSADAQEKSEKALANQIEVMNRTVRLNGYNAMVEYFNIRAQIQTSRGGNPNPELENAEKYVKKIHEILSMLE